MNLSESTLVLYFTLTQTQQVFCDIRVGPEQKYSVAASLLINGKTKLEITTYADILPAVSQPRTCA